MSDTIKNVRFFNVTAKGENGVLIHGNDENIIEDITFENEDEFKELLIDKEYYLYTVIDCEEE